MRARPSLPDCRWAHRGLRRPRVTWLCLLLAACSQDPPKGPPSNPAARQERAVIVQSAIKNRARAGIVFMLAGGEVLCVSPRRLGHREAMFIYPAIHPAGTHVVYCGGTTWPPRVWRTDLDTMVATPITPADWAAFGPAYSADGSKLVFNASTDSAPQPGEEAYRWEELWRDGFPTDKTGHVYTMNSDGSGLVQVTRGAKGGWRPTLSPDGKTVVFVSSRPEQGLYSAPSDGSAEPRLLVAGALRPSFSHDGKRIYFHRNIKDRADAMPGLGGASNGIHWIPAEGGEATLFEMDTHGHSCGPFADPAGEAVLMHSTRDSVKDLGRAMFRVWELQFDGEARPLPIPGFEEVTTAHGSRALDGTTVFDTGAPDTHASTKANRLVDVLLGPRDDLWPTAVDLIDEAGVTAVPALATALLPRRPGAPVDASAAGRAAARLAAMQGKAVWALPLMLTSLAAADTAARPAIASALAGVAPHAPPAWQRRIEKEGIEFERIEPPATTPTEVARLTRAAELVLALAEENAKKRQATVRGLLALRAAAVSPLVNAVYVGACCNGDQKIALRAAGVLAAMRARAIPGLPILVAALERAEGNRRRPAVLALAGIAPHAPGYWRTRVRVELASWLRKTVPASATGIVDVADKPILMMAVRAYSRTLLHTAGARSEVVAALNHPNPFARALAAYLLPFHLTHGHLVHGALTRAAKQEHPKTVVVHTPAGPLRFRADADDEVQRTAAATLRLFERRKKTK